MQQVGLPNMTSRPKCNYKSTYKDGRGAYIKEASTLIQLYIQSTHKFDKRRAEVRGREE